MSKVMKSVFMLIFVMISLILLFAQGPGHKVQTNVERQNISLLFDSAAKTFQPWKNDTNCQKFLTQFTKRGSLPARALVSFPGSGNTWIRWARINKRIQRMLKVVRH